MNLKILGKPIHVYVKTTQTTNETPEKIGKLWQEFFQENQQITCFGIYHDYASDHTDMYNLSVGGLHQTTGYDLFIIPAGTYMVFTTTYGIDGVQAIWKTIWNDPNILKQRAFSTDFEWYHEDGSVDVYIAIK